MHSENSNSKLQASLAYRIFVLIAIWQVTATFICDSVAKQIRKRYQVERSILSFTLSYKTERKFGDSGKNILLGQSQVFIIYESRRYRRRFIIGKLLSELMSKEKEITCSGKRKPNSTTTSNNKQKKKLSNSEKPTIQTKAWASVKLSVSQLAAFPCGGRRIKSVRYDCVLHTMNA